MPAASPRPVYMMHSTTSPLDPRVRAVMAPLLDEDPASPGGLLADSGLASRLVEEARERVGSWLNAAGWSVVFTSGGTESCNLALKGAALARLARGGRPGRVVACATEHLCVLHPARTLGKLGFEVLEAPVDSHGLIDLERLEGLLCSDVVLVTVAAANGETGTMQPMEAIAAMAHRRGALLHSDACILAAYRRPDLGELKADLVSVSAHKMGGPRGIGALAVRDGVRLLPLLEGGVEEGGLRAGAPYVAGIAGFGEAALLKGSAASGQEERMETLGKEMESLLLGIDGVRLNGHPARRLRGMVNVSAEGVDGEAVLLKLARRGIAASSGSSCYHQAGKPSHVLTAMGVPAERAAGSVLFSLGPASTRQDVDRAGDVFAQAVRALRALAPGRPG
ncbi:MAG TPA: cysteine desulfurase family protein [Candidatus Polarisedimenticolia bacterium]|nr:cysteine desulfurase family protein [Candidatus Polarisedimenticolia bacterium]